METQETKLPLKETAYGERTFKNVTLKPKWNRTDKKLMPGVFPGEHVVLTKKFPDGREIVSSKLVNKDGSPVISYSAVATDADGNEVSFFLTPAEHDAFVALGDAGTVFTATTTKETYVNSMTGAEGTKYVLHLARVE